MRYFAQLMFFRRLYRLVWIIVNKVREKRFGGNRDFSVNLGLKHENQQKMDLEKKK